MVGSLRRIKGRRKKIGEGNYRYHRGKGKWSIHSPKLDRKRPARTKLKKFGSRSRSRKWRHVAD